MPPGALDCDRMSARMHVNETDRSIDNFMCVAVSLYVPECRQAVTDDCSAGFDPDTKNSHQRFGGSVRNG
jgi:hypothetical protein